MLQGWCIAEMDFYSTDMVGLCYGRVKNKEKNDWGQNFNSGKYGPGEHERPKDKHSTVRAKQRARALHSVNQSGVN